MYGFDVGSIILRLGYYPKCGACACDSALSAHIIQLCLLPQLLLIRSQLVAK